MAQTRCGAACAGARDAARANWTEAGAAYVRRAGVLYGWGLRHLVMVAPLVASLLQPLAGPVAALVVVVVMRGVDRVGARDRQAATP